MLIVPTGLPAQSILRKEGVHIISRDQAIHQDIRPLRIVIFNLMPDKRSTEVQILRLLSRTPIQVEVSLLHTESYQSKHTSPEYLSEFYVNFRAIEKEFFDALIITGAPLETKPFPEVEYWDELKVIMDWSRSHVYSVFHICWGALAGLYHHYRIRKCGLEYKLSGVYVHQKTIDGYDSLLTQDFDDIFSVPHSRFAGVNERDLTNQSEVVVLAQSKQAGTYLLANKNLRHVFVTGHPEYDRTTLGNEYDRDIALGLKPAIPLNYFPDNDVGQIPISNWQSHGQLLYSNWINSIYQNAPFERQEIATLTW